MKAFLDFIPLLAFFYFAKTESIIFATAALLISSLIVFGIHFFTQKGKLDKQQWVVLILTIVFCGFTLLLKDDTYLRWKSPIINGIFSLTLLVSIMMNKPLMQMAMKSVFSLTDNGWKKLTFAWAMFFAMMAGLHYMFAFIYPEHWVDFKTFGWIPFMLSFMIGQFVVLRKSLNTDMLDDAKQIKKP